MAASHLPDTVATHGVGLSCISPLPCWLQLKQSDDRGLAGVLVDLLGHLATCCTPIMLHDRGHLTRPNQQSSATEVVDGRLKQPMVWDLEEQQ